MEVPKVGTTSCNRCHYNSSNYAVDIAVSDFPHSGGVNEYKLLGNYSMTTAPTPDASTAVVWGETTITANNLDAVCIRCHTDHGVMQ